ncbi:hypothetical protein MNB_SV-14-2 [hydrothermal vent metagenome]|uniref:Indole-3-glycerol-phosphate synthase n=1 Tax=hydrothermal vent metagenome TaxID=652676 RepID=A0A1W1CT81_9ZZZZ
MKIFGHPLIETEQFYLVKEIEEIAKTPSNIVLKIEKFDIELMRYCKKNSLSYMVNVNDIKEAIFANLLGAKYIKASKSLAKELMPIAQNYLFDSQILGLISKDSEIEELAKANVDGAWFK